MTRSIKRPFWEILEKDDLNRSRDSTGENFERAEEKFSRSLQAIQSNNAEALRVRQDALDCLVSAHKTAVSTSKKVIEGGDKGIERLYGSPKDRQERFENYLVDCIELGISKPGLRLTKIREIVAKKHDVSLRTVERYTKDLGKKLGR